MKVHELIDILTNPKWWPHDLPNMNAEVCVCVECPDETAPGAWENGHAAHVYHVNINPVDKDRRIHDEDQLESGRPTIVISFDPDR